MQYPRSHSRRFAAFAGLENAAEQFDSIQEINS